MRQRRSYAAIITIIYTAVILLTLVSFFLLGFSESLVRFVISLAAVLLGESITYGYSIYWLRTAAGGGGKSPVLISGAYIIAIYIAVVLLLVVILDRLLHIPAAGYAAAQLLVMIAGISSLAATAFYGRNATAQENKAEGASRSFRRHRDELEEIRRLARSWKHTGAERLLKLLHGLEENFKYSDPVSNAALYATEDLLRQQISLLHDQVELLLAAGEPQTDWEETFGEMADSINATLQRRNRELAALK
ncbi:hypothetical protein [Paenibacillus donghaensis]|uniref:Uncharacterized protein n=1 Tax=Paenibacillus donghaensis TaxID=414771 RepID=A0A2Z2KCW7_9BACL|nr:hypothetical protein [Paenibacillus donghaensis]ASA23754.1 hypothetical protein B9T62_25025 [Paenibacillus donghaensis]